MIGQTFLPGFPEGSMKVGDGLSILNKEGRVTYFVGSDNYFSHASDDEPSRRFILATLIENGHVRPCDLEKEPLCISHRTLMNWTGRLRKKGPDSFYRERSRRNPRVMTPENAATCTILFAEGMSVAEVVKQTGLGESTIRKAIKRGAILKKTAAENDGNAASAGCKAGTTKSERGRVDAEAAEGMGTACTRVNERVAAAMGLAKCATGRFENSRDVDMGGLMTGLPALCDNGLLSGIGKYTNLPDGFYSCLHILMTLAFMALGRVRRPEGLRHIPPGEFGKVIGLDRVPEAKTLREKITEMARAGHPEAWMKELSRRWMQDDPAEAGYLYVDGHVRVYHGGTAELPRRYVSGKLLCLRGTTDYWVNDALGRPFFVVSKAVTEGLADTLLKEIVPELLTSVPRQPTAEQLGADPLLHRFMIVFDREGATHSLLSALWQKRVGAITYRKNVRDAWPENEFIESEVPVPGGGNTKMKLAVRETALTAGEASIPVAEVRRLTSTGHQTAVISTARRLGNTTIAGRMFSRWCQENFFAYMMEHYEIDGLVQYGAEALPGTLMVVNPAWRALDKAVRDSYRGVKKLQAKLGAEESRDDGADIQKKAEYVQDIQAAKVDLERYRAERAKTERKVKLDSLPEDQRPTQLLPLNKQLTDTVKMIAYRAETAMVAILRRYLEKEEEARALVRELFVSSADIEPDDTAKTLTIHVHRMACPAHDKAVAALMKELTAREFRHPETGAKMIYALA